MRDLSPAQVQRHVAAVFADELLEAVVGHQGKRAAVDVDRDSVKELARVGLGFLLLFLVLLPSLAHQGIFYRGMGPRHRFVPCFGSVWAA